MLSINSTILPLPPQRDLDTLTYSGSTINELEIQLTQYRLQYKRVLSEAQARLDQLRKRLNSHIVKSEPFIDVWRKARLVQEESNKAAARLVACVCVTTAKLRHSPMYSLVLQYNIQTNDVILYIIWYDVICFSQHFLALLLAQCCSDDVTLYAPLPSLHG